ncbi:MAG: hypothetical protein K2K80_03840 [Clostridia bacterium]|nr:hypothetical protein [Clostridia bacterium]
MLCQRCKKNVATKLSVEIIDGERFESFICDRCSLELGGEFINADFNDNACAWLFGSSAPRKACPVCGTTYADYEKTGLLGCPSCYDVFKEELLPAIDAIHGKVVHIGKVGTNKDEMGLHRRLKSLQEQLELAMKEKRFVDAGMLNRRIREISKILYGGGNE